MKKTAVEWLMQKWYSDEFIGEEDFNQAKAMEKEQIKKHTYQLCKLILSSPIEKSGKTPIELFEQYYNETFKP